MGVHQAAYLLTQTLGLNTESSLSSTSNWITDAAIVSTYFYQKTLMRPLLFLIKWLSKFLDFWSCAILFFENVFTSRSLHFTKLLPSAQGWDNVKNVLGTSLFDGYNLPPSPHPGIICPKLVWTCPHVPILSGGPEQDHRVVFQYSQKNLNRE